MNPRLQRLYPYPFERLSALKDGIAPAPGLEPIALSVGEPRHPPPAFAAEILAGAAGGLSRYQLTRGGDALREAVAQWLWRRYRARVDPAQVLAVNGTREALFAFAQCLLDPLESGARVLMPNPFYQIYEGAALLAGAEPCYMNCTEENGFLPDLGAVDEADWRRCRLIYVCSPGNPGGAVWPRELWRELLDRADRYGFVIASDECYSELYFDRPPPGLLQVCAELGRDGFDNCIVFNSLSKRSSLPGLRSGFVAGERRLIEAFLRYRTYHGGAMSDTVQALSVAAWQDEAHVAENRELYRQKLDAVWPRLAEALPLPRPEAGFFFWPRLPGDDQSFAAELYRRQNVLVLPGSYLARDTPAGNPGVGRARLALVAPLEQCIAAADRLRAFLTTPHEAP